MNDIKGMVGGIQKYSTSDGRGIRTTVFLKGCPLKCRWCHNPELIEFKQQVLWTKQKCISCHDCIAACPIGALAYNGRRIEADESRCLHCYKCVEHCYSEALRLAGQEMTVSEIIEKVRQDKGYYRRTGGGMTISGGELLYQADFAEALLDAAAEEGIDTALDTSGMGDGEKLYNMAKKAESVLYDMKAIDDDTHKICTGHSNKTIIENLISLADDAETNFKVWMRMPLIKGLNDGEDIIRETAEFYKKHSLKRVTLLPYHELGISKYKNLGVGYENFEAPEEKRLLEIKSIFEGAGIRAEILGKGVK